MSSHQGHHHQHDLNLNTFLPKEFASNFPLSHDSRSIRINSLTSLSSTTSTGSRTLSINSVQTVPKTHTYSRSSLKDDSIKSTLLKWEKSVPKLFQYSPDDLRIVFHRKNGEEELFRYKRRRKKVQGSTENDSSKIQTFQNGSIPKKLGVEDLEGLSKAQNHNSSINSLSNGPSSTSSIPPSPEKRGRSGSITKNPQFTALFGSNAELTPVETHPQAEESLKNTCPECTSLQSLYTHLKEEFGEIKEDLEVQIRENSDLKNEISALRKNLTVIQGREHYLAKEMDRFQVSISKSELNLTNSPLTLKVQELLFKTTPINSLTGSPVQNHVKMDKIKGQGLLEGSKGIQSLQERISELEEDESDPNSSKLMP